MVEICDTSPKVPYSIFHFKSARRREIAEISPISVTHHTTEKFRGYLVVDKDLSTHAATTNVDGLGWLKLEFDKTYLINKVVIYYEFYTNWFNPERWCAQSDAYFKQCVDKDNNVDVSVYQGEVEQKSCGTLQLTYGLEQSDQIYTLLCNAEGDNVRLSKVAGRILVFEVAVTVSGKIF